MREHAARDGAALGVGCAAETPPGGCASPAAGAAVERSRTRGRGPSPAPSTDRIGSSADARATTLIDRAGTRRGAGSDGGCLSHTAVCARDPRARRRARRPSQLAELGQCGSGSIVSGTQAIGSGNGRNGSSRTASFSVVRTGRAPAARASPHDPVDVAARVAMMIAERQRVRAIVQPGGAQIPRRSRSGRAMPATATTGAAAGAPAPAADRPAVAAPMVRRTRKIGNGACRGLGPSAHTARRRRRSRRRPAARRAARAAGPTAASARRRRGRRPRR